MDVHLTEVDVKPMIQYGTNDVDGKETEMKAQVTVDQQH